MMQQIQADDSSNSAAEPNIESPQSTTIEPAQSATVTSTQSCYDQLEPAEALQIQRTSLKPYQECLELLSSKMEKEKTIAVDKATAEAVVPEAENPRNYVRVQNTAPAAPLRTNAEMLPVAPIVKPKIDSNTNR